MATGFAPKGATPLLKTTSGLHRFKWDLRHTGSWDQDASKNGKNGAMVAPDTYTIQMTIADQVYTHPLTVAIDPRLQESNVTTADLLEQEALVIKIRDLQSRAKQLAYTVEKQRKRLQERDTSLDRKKEVLALLEIKNAQQNDAKFLEYATQFMHNAINPVCDAPSFAHDTHP